MKLPRLSFLLLIAWASTSCSAQITVRDDGSVGDTGTPPYGDTEANGRVQNLAVDSQNNLYTVSWWEEAHHELRKLDGNGKPLWGTSFVGGVAIATDGEAVFASRSPAATRAKEKADEVHRFRAADGKPWPFANGSNVIAINSGKVDPRPAGQVLYTPEQRRQWEAVRGLAVDSARLWISNYAENRVEVFDKNSGKRMASFAVSKPLGIAVEADSNFNAAKRGAVWIANSGDRITRFAYGSEYSVAPGAEIKGLAHPYSVVIGGPQRHLYATTLGDGKIRQWAVNGNNTPRLTGLQEFGGEHVPGPVRADRFQWKFEDGHHIGGLAVDGEGRFHVTDLGNFRTQHFAPDGAFRFSIASELVVSAFADRVSATRHRLFSNALEYEVDTSGKPQPGWQGDGSWRLVANWRPTDNLFHGATVRRSLLVNGARRDFLFSLRGLTTIYAVEGDSMRRSVIVGGEWRGTDGLQPSLQTQYIWRDMDGNGKIDVPAVGEGEMTIDPKARRDVTGYAGPQWVDESGNIWFPNFLSASGYYGDIVKLPLQGFDAKGNPLYDWTKREVVVPRDTSETAFGARYLRIAANGDIWAMGNSKPGGDSGAFHFGGNTVVRFDSSGKRIGFFPTIGTRSAGMMPDSDGRFFVAYSEASGHWVELRDAEGKVLATARPGEKSGPNPGWIDTPYSFYAFTINGVRYTYAEDVVYGKNIRYRFDNVP